MGKKLLAKASMVQSPRQPVTLPSTLHGGEEGEKPKTAIGAMAQFTDRQSHAIREAAQLKEQLKEFENCLATKAINPELITRSRWANRHKSSFMGPEFENLKTDIRAHGGNVQPIKVRRLKADPGKYEIVFGHRRHQACLQLAINVLALIDDLDDKHLFIEMDRENRQKKELRPFEIGVMYAQALDEGLFVSARRLAEEVGIDQSQLAKALALARLPDDVLNAFLSPLDLQYRWVSDLNKVIQKDLEWVVEIAQRIQAELPRPTSTLVFKRLTAGRGTVPHDFMTSTSLEGVSGKKGKLEFNSKERRIRVTIENIDPSQFIEVKVAIEKLLGSTSN